jgi:hypothetical protein
MAFVVQQVGQKSSVSCKQALKARWGRLVVYAIPTFSSILFEIVIVKCIWFLTVICVQTNRWVDNKDFTFYPSNPFTYNLKRWKCFANTPNNGQGAPIFQHFLSTTWFNPEMGPLNVILLIDFLDLRVGYQTYLCVYKYVHKGLRSVLAST